MVKQNRKELQKERTKLKNGLDKLQQTNELVASLQKELSLLQPELTKKVYIRLVQKVAKFIYFYNLGFRNGTAAKANQRRPSNSRWCEACCDGRRGCDFR